MALNWITSSGDIANLLVGVSANLQVEAVDFSIPEQVINYQLISGSLPTGLSLATVNVGGTTAVYAGVISGTPTYSSISNAYQTNQEYDFVIRATAASGQAVDRSFRILVSSSINGDFYWVTPAGSLGTVPAGEFYQLQLQVIESHGNPVSFSYLSGTLPAGIQVTANGYLEGVPTLQTAALINETQNYRFTVRATSNIGHINDRGFNLTVTSVAGPTIEPSTGSPTNLGSYFDGAYFSQQLYVNELGANVGVTWSTVGTLPPGLSVSNTGLISGYIQPSPVTGNFGPADYDGYTYTGPTVNAGSFVTGVEYIIKSGTTTDWIAIGAKNNSIGTGFIATGPGSGDGVAYIVSELTVTQSQELDFGPYDFDNINQSVTYNFTVQAYDGANYDLQTYSLTVLSRNGFTADSTALTTDNTFVTVDSYSTYTPVILNSTASVLPTARGSGYYAYKFDGYDFQGDAITYALVNVVGTFDCAVVGVDDGFDYNGTSVIGFDYASYIASFGGGTVSTSNLPGLTLDANTGWLYGQLTPENSSLTTYSFGVQVSKTRANVTYTSVPTYFSLSVLGDIKNVVNWTTPADLGTIDNGSVSQLILQATSPENKTIVYTIVDQSNVPARLPQGLTLLPTGEISGRVSFEAFSLDDYATTFDGEALTIDRTYKFTVKAATFDGTASNTQEFTLKLNVIDVQPYNNLYLEALPAWDQRQIFNSVVTDTEIFPAELIYRPADPWFGVAKNIEMLFLPGLNADSLDAYVEAISKNHWTKSYNFGSIKTAVVLDNNYHTKYEVVYIEVVDPELNSSNAGPAAEIDLTHTIANPYIDASGNTYKIVYPNTTENMIDQLVENIGYYDQSSLPEWMTSNQPDPKNPNGFTNPLGFTKGVVLAYTVAGASNLIAYRLRNSGINFNNIAFTVDRYLLDNYYSTNFNNTTKTYISGRETTFDATQATGANKIAATVTYAVSVPFDAINGRYVSYINDNGGLDGITQFQDGDTLIFVKQENFNNAGPYDGWVDYTDAYLGYNIVNGVNGFGGPVAGDPATSALDSYDQYTVIPGYLNKIQNISAVNQQGGVWRINIVNDIVNLSFVKEIEIGDKVRVIAGYTHVGALLYYNGNLNAGQTVPAYSKFVYLPTTAIKRTTFNADTTRFFSHRDSYYTPGSQDKYVKFPQYGVFN